MICSTTYRSALALAGAAVMTLGTFGILKAQAPWDAPRMKLVGYQAAALSHPAYTAHLYRRIQKAADKVCGDVPVQDLAARAAHQRCVEESVTRAVADINRPELSALHSATMSRWQASTDRHEKPEA